MKARDVRTGTGPQRKAAYYNGSDCGRQVARRNLLTARPFASLEALRRVPRDLAGRH
jgi:hypothetical protein